MSIAGKRSPVDQTTPLLTLLPKTGMEMSIPPWRRAQLLEAQSQTEITPQELAMATAGTPMVPMTKTMMKETLMPMKNPPG